jgi:hypothetical protein
MKRQTDGVGKATRENPRASGSRKAGKSDAADVLRRLLLGLADVYTKAIETLDARPRAVSRPAPGTPVPADGTALERGLLVEHVGHAMCGLDALDRGDFQTAILIVFELGRQIGARDQLPGLAGFLGNLQRRRAEAWRQSRLDVKEIAARTYFGLRADNPTWTKGKAIKKTVENAKAAGIEISERTLQSYLKKTAAH